MKKIAVVGIFALISVAVYFAFFKKSKEEQLSDILVTNNNQLKSTLTEKEIELFKELLLNIQTITELREYCTAFENLCNDKDADLLIVVEELLPESVQIAVIADWQEKGIVDVDSLSEKEIESGKMNSSFSQKNSAKRIDIKNVTITDIRTLLNCNEIYITEKNSKYQIHNVVKKTEMNPYFEVEDIQNILNSGNYYVTTYRSDLSDSSILRVEKIEPK